jgi:hypothetical protein
LEIWRAPQPFTSFHLQVFVPALIDQVKAFPADKTSCSSAQAAENGIAAGEKVPQLNHTSISPG